MPRILHHQLDPASRLVRLMFAEYGVPLELVEIKPWTREAQFLELNPAATVPVAWRRHISSWPTSRSVRRTSRSCR